MDVVTNNFLPGDQRLVDQIVYELKSQGIFDQFRKECFADVDTKPAYQNLRQRVEGNVTRFLKGQSWRPDMNKNQVREMLRKSIYESGYLETGVERIVDQVVNPKINTVFLPKVEEVVYSLLGIEKPIAEIKKEKTDSNSGETNLLPNDLEAVSPESETFGKNDGSKTMNTSNNDTSQETVEDNSKVEDDESPPFEPLDEQSLHVQEEDSIDSHISGFSGLISKESNQSNEIKGTQIDLITQDSQMSQNSSESRLSIVTSEDNTKMDICEDSQTKSVKSIDNNSDLSNTDKEKSQSSINDIEKNKSNSKTSDSSNHRHHSRSETKYDRDRKSDKDKKSNRDSKSHHSSASSKDKHRERKDSKSSSSKNEGSSSSSKDKNGKEKDRNKSTSSGSNSNKHSSSTKDKKESKKESSSNKEKSSSSRSSSNKDSKTTSSNSSKSKDDQRHHKSSSSSDKSSSKKDSKYKSSSSSSSSNKLSKDKRRESKKDDHYSFKDKKFDRRSTDRDSNDGHSMCKSNNTNNSSTHNRNISNKATQDSTSSKSNNSGGGGSGGDSTNSDKNEVFTLNNNGKMKLMKPKFASNIHEARKLMKIRKQLAKLEKQNQLSLASVEVDNSMLISASISLETLRDNGLKINNYNSVNNNNNNNKVDKELLKDEIETKNRVVTQDSWDAMEAKLQKEINNINHYSEDNVDDIDNKVVEKSYELAGLDETNSCKYLVNNNKKENDEFLKFVHKFIILQEIEIEKLRGANNNCIENNENLKLALKRKQNDLKNNNIPNKKKKITPNNFNINGQINNELITTNPFPPNGSFTLPLSPSDSDLSIEKKDISPIRNNIKQKNKVLNNQRYSSDDLYKPRPVIFSSRRRGAKNNDMDK